MNKKKVLLINPFFINDDFCNNYFDKHVCKITSKIIPPMGLLYIASYLEKNGILVDIFDFVTSTKKNLFKIIKTQHYDFIGIGGAFLENYMGVKNLSEKIRNYSPNSILLVGGSDASLNPQKYLAKDFADIVVIGEGEQTFLHIYRKYPQIDKIKGISYLKNKKIYKTESCDRIHDLDKLPFPDFSKITLSKYTFPFFMRKTKKILPIRLSRGCPYCCSYCIKPVFGKTITFRSTNNVIAEIEYNIRKFGIKEYIFLDDTFTLNKANVLKFCKKVKNLDIKYQIATRADCMDIELLSALKTSGCYLIEYGIESGSEKILKKMKRTMKVHDIINIIKKTSSHNILVKVNFIAGYPGEEITDLKKSIKIAMSSEIYIARFSRYVDYTKKKQTHSRYEFMRNLSIISFYFRFFANKKRLLTYVYSIKSVKDIIDIFFFIIYLTGKITHGFLFSKIDCRDK